VRFGPRGDIVFFCTACQGGIAHCCEGERAQPEQQAQSEGENPNAPLRITKRRPLEA
jgi:hypothetical protein